jgi:antibiotic biosynthesis monooxygenase (ABM) superfamily enzyme
MAIVIFFAAYAISSLSRSILNPFLEQWPILGSAVIYTAILVVSLTYFALPIANRMLRHWLYPGTV